MEHRAVAITGDISPDQPVPGCLLGLVGVIGAAVDAEHPHWTTPRAGQANSKDAPGYGGTCG